MAPSTVLLRRLGSRNAEKDTYLVRMGRGIATVRSRRQLTRKGLANRLEVTIKRLGDWERGVYQPPLAKLIALCGVLAVTVEELLAEGEARVSTRLRRHDSPGTSERRRSMSNETSVTVESVEVEPGVVPIEPDLKSERVQEESVAPISPSLGPVVG